jgi:hypothetical protein
MVHKLIDVSRKVDLGRVTFVLIRERTCGLIGTWSNILSESEVNSRGCHRENFRSRPGRIASQGCETQGRLDRSIRKGMSKKPGRKNASRSHSHPKNRKCCVALVEVVEYREGKAAVSYA